MRVINSLLLLLSISSFFTGVLYSKTPYQGDLSLLLTRWSHYTVLTFATLYPFLFNKRYDLFYILFAIMLFLSWKLFNGECPLSYLEKVYIDKNYKMGYDVTSHPYVDILAEDMSEVVWLVLGTQINLVFIYVVARYSFNNIKNPYIRYTNIAVAFGIFLYYSSYIVERIKKLRGYSPREKQLS